MPLAVNDVLRVKVYCMCDQQLGINVLGYRVTNVTGTGMEPFEVADLLALRWQDEYAALMTTNASFRGVSCQRIHPGNAGSTEFSEAYDIPGTAGTEGLPKQTCGVISWKTALAGRAFQGRIYIPFPDEEDNADLGKPITTYVDRLSDLADQISGTITLVDGVNTLDIMHIVQHRIVGTGEPVTRFVPRKIWGTQRRRGDYGAKNVSPI